MSTALTCFPSSPMRFNPIRCRPRTSSPRTRRDGTSVLIMYRHGLRVSWPAARVSARFGFPGGTSYPKRQRRWLRKFTQYGVGRYPDRSAYLNELNDFEAPLASFIFGNKRLMSM